ncbi:MULTISPECIES: hypothetical protein [Phocaeicola]|jgi:hypothetical protein|uniref:hypothetical protein n=1 Tax=Phocaeicola TaxID=909656 RepID=UPI0018A03CD0|nr:MULTISPECIES: hypothetical protein [Phocaeicola]MCE8443273.1 hypothetical protein [Phocaeicola dorei]MDC1727297.1 hypothetical protein [Phocaeicola vulgatus]UWG00170.1 MAG: hypothetical protein [Bacteriophage sp.]DAY88783.1 MAG TPA: hypothetical protein [Caudoviricetes sp.]
MNVLEELFIDVAQFHLYSPYAESNMNFKDLASSAMSAIKQVQSVISPDIYKKIAAGEDNDEKDALRSAVANLTLAKQLIFNVLSLRKSDVDIYKNEQEQMRRAYRDNYYNAMDTLLQLLDSDEEWKKTKTYKALENLKLKTTYEFDASYPIDNSFLYFFRCVPIQQEALDDYVSGYYERLPEKDQTNRRKLDRCLAKITVALSLRRFDILEFPSTIRNLFEDSKVMRYGTQEQERMLTLSDDLMSQALESLKNIDLSLSGNTDVDIVTETSFNRPDDKIYLMP